MANVFDQFDVPQQAAPPPDVVPAQNGQPTRITVRPPGASNPFDQFDKPSEAPKTTSGQAFGRGIMQGATFNFYDELNGLARAGGLEPDDPNVANALKSIITGAYGKLVGNKEAERLYDEEVKLRRGETAQLEKEHPVASIGGEVTGAMAVPVGGAAGAATLPARIARGVGLGAGIGGLSGFGAGEGTGGSIKGAVGGVLAGGILGGAAPAIADLAVRGIRAGTNAIRSGLRGAVNPEAEASRRVAMTIERDIRSDPAAANRLTPQEFTANVQGGGPATVMDLGGETTRALARSAANTSPEGRQALTAATSDRFEGQGDRVTGWLRNTFNFPNAHAQQQALDQTAGTVNRQSYAIAYRAGDRQVWSPELERLTSSPDVTAAMREAATKGKSRAVNQGFGGFNPGVTVDNGGIVTFQRGPTGQPTYPNLQFWDYTKRALDDAANAARRAGRNEEASTLGQLSRGLRAELDNIVPEYANARAGAAAFFGAENALEAGQNFVMQNFATRETRAALARMSPQERQLFQDGFVSRLIETIDRVPDRQNVVGRIFNSEASREKIRLALGPQRALELEAGLRVEGILDRARTAVSGNSTTARQWIERGMAGGGLTLGSVGAYNTDPQQLTTAAVLAALAGGSRRIDQRVAARVANMLVSNDPAVLARGVSIIARSEHFMEAVRRADRKLVSTTGQQGANVPVLQAAGIGRPEDNQPAVPRPPGQ